jgi:hypothetical protein
MSWATTIRELLPPLAERGLLDDLDGFTPVSADSFNGKWIGRYVSYKKHIVVNEAAVPESRERVLLHELGHHLHYQKVLGDPDDYTRQEWSTALKRDLPSEEAVEWVAWKFAHYHEGRLDASWNKLLYQRLGGPRLADPLHESVDQTERQSKRLCVSPPSNQSTMIENEVSD